MASPLKHTMAMMSPAAKPLKMRFYHHITLTVQVKSPKREIPLEYAVSVCLFVQETHHVEAMLCVCERLSSFVASQVTAIRANP
jgi:hypothetical protein